MFRKRLKSNLLFSIIYNEDVIGSSDVYAHAETCDTAGVIAVAIATS